MHLVHIALGGCLTAPPVRYGITEDTGGHIAYVLGAAKAQSVKSNVSLVTIITRFFDAVPILGRALKPVEYITPKLRIVRLKTSCVEYLEKGDLDGELPALEEGFLQFIRAASPYVDHIHAHFADAAVLAHAAQLREGIPYAYTPHSLAYEKQHCGQPLADIMSSGRFTREKAAIDSADHIIVSSRDEAERQLRSYSHNAEGRTICVSPGTTLNAAPLNSQLAKKIETKFAHVDKPTILAIARPIWKKNLIGLLNAYASRATLRSMVNLIIVAGHPNQISPNDGEAWQVISALKAAIAEQNLEGSVYLPGEHRPEDIEDYYRYAASRRGIFVNSAHHEPFGLTLLEAANHGLPVVATNKGGPVDILRQTQHGRLVDPTDEADIADTCSTLLSNDILYQRCRDAAFKVRSRYNWKQWAGKVNDRVIAKSSNNIKRRFKPKTVKSICAFDIDGTLTGSARGAVSFTVWAQEERSDADLYAVATGRSISQAINVLKKNDLPEPDIWITSVGSEIWRRSTNGVLKRCESYAHWVEHDWDPQTVDACAMAAGISAQAPYEQRDFKRSYLGNKSDAQRLEALFKARGCAACVVYSHGRLIDVLPRRSGKAGALRFEAARYNLNMSSVLAAGNSGNDADMLGCSGNAIVVGNADHDLDFIKTAPHCYVAQSAFADGVMEGLIFFHRAPATGAGRVLQREYPHDYAH